MTDTPLSDLFTDGTAPEHDPAFEVRVTAAIGAARLRMRLVALARRATLMLVVSVVVFWVMRLGNPVIAPLVERLPHFMGVPLPLVLAVPVAAIALRARLHLALPHRRFASPFS